MDLDWNPRVALRRLRTLVIPHRKVSEAGKLDTAEQARDDAMIVLSELTEWLSTGGLLPWEWDRWA